MRVRFYDDMEREQYAVGWWLRAFSEEQQMVYDLLAPGEEIIAVVGGIYHPEQEVNYLHEHLDEDIFGWGDLDEDIFGWGDLDEQEANCPCVHSVTAVATDCRVMMFLIEMEDEFRLDDECGCEFGLIETSVISYESIEDTIYSAEGVQIIGRSENGWRVESAYPEESAKVFTEIVQSELERVRIDKQWYAVAPEGWGPFGDEGMHSGERQMLYDHLMPDENIVALVGGTYRAEQDTNRRHKHKGVALATDHRVIFLDKGIFGSTETSIMPYDSIEGVTHSTGMFMAGVQIIGRGGSGWRIEDVSPKESAKLFADAVQRERDRLMKPPPAPYSVSPVSESISELATLADLLDRGLLTRDEFNLIKARLLGLDN